MSMSNQSASEEEEELDADEIDRKWQLGMYELGLLYMRDFIRKHFSKYEIFLAKKLMRNKSQEEKIYILNCIQTYYRFLICIRMYPHLANKTDDEIMYDVDNSEEVFTIEELFMKIYFNERGDPQKIENMRTEFGTLLKENSDLDLDDSTMKAMLHIFKLHKDYSL